jgi:general secretion pathway protein E
MLSEIAKRLAALDPNDAEYATKFVDQLLGGARQIQASDVHLLPTAEGLAVSWRSDGVLQSVGVFPSGSLSDVVTRLKVMADLLTYRTDVPQEGRIKGEAGVEMRLSTLPTLHGEKAVVRLFQSALRFERLADLGFSDALRQQIEELIKSTTGAILVSGPAGSGKTTTLYALLRELSSQSGNGRSLVTLEDPIEVQVPGVTQSQASAAAGYDFASGLRAIVRQDPEVIMVGEIRDRATAEVALQASLTGQLVLSSFHAGSAATAISRLLDMGIEPYVLRSGVKAVISQRLVRKLCECAGPAGGDAKPNHERVPVGCEKCNGTGYRGRVLLAELLRPDCRELHEAILSRADAESLAELARNAGMVDLRTQAQQLVQAGLTSAEEITRVLGLRQT